ncbi:uncharacterized protein [Musca autumnalis]|uniref:uncharacterized protein n=1 Tax=Musca autumnalis TaxID=221902 RepID=UPI003CF098FE
MLNFYTTQINISQIETTSILLSTYFETFTSEDIIMDPINNTLEDEQRVQSPFLPITPKDSLSAMDSEPPIPAPKRTITKSLKLLPNKRTIPTKTMVREALKTITKSKEDEQQHRLSRKRKTLSLRGIQKFMALKYFVTTPEMKTRMPYVRKYIRELLNLGHLKPMKNGASLTGSFWIPAKSQLKKDLSELKKKPQAKASAKSKTKGAKSKAKRTGGKMTLSRRTM